MMTSLLSNLKNVITVSPQNGDFTNLDAAIAAVASKASVNNPFLIVVGPGVYSVSSTLKMVPYVNIKGSGIGITILEGAIGASGFSQTAAILAMSTACQVSSLSIRNLGNSKPCSIGVYCNQNGSLDDVFVSATSDMDNACGIYTDSVKPAISNSSVSASAPSNSSTKSFGILAEGTSAPNLDNVTINAIGGAYAYGLFHSGQFNLDVNNSYILSEEGSQKSYCVFVDSGEVVIRNSELFAPSSSSVGPNSLYAVWVNNASYAATFFSSLVRGEVGGPGNARFFATFDSGGRVP